MRKKSNRSTVCLFILLLLAVCFFLADLFSGSVRIPPAEIMHALFEPGSTRPEWASIVREFRLPKALTAILAGMALSVSGLQMQTVFRNPLAGPYVLGISSGASLGVAILLLGFYPVHHATGDHLAGNWPVAWAAWLGSGAVLMLILVVSFRVRDIMTILILGILFGSITLAIVSILQYFSEASMLKSFVVWTMGSLGSVTRSQLTVLSTGVAAGLTISVFLVKMLNTLLLGEEYARTLGINILWTRILIFISTSLLAGSVTAFCGPIGFIGIAVPHIARLLFGTTDHRKLLPGTILIGSVIMSLSDIISRLPGHEIVLPVNSVTALIGIPVVVWIILRRHRISSFTA